MKLAVSAILFLAVGTLTEAHNVGVTHNVRVGHTSHEAKQERTKHEVKRERTKHEVAGRSDSGCVSNTDCTTAVGGPRCILDSSGTAPSYCGPLAYNGDPCSMGEDCDSSFCNYVGSGMMCVECMSSADCTTSIGGPRCVHDSSFSAPSICAPKAYNGSPCSMGEDCDSSLCNYVGSGMMCVECMSSTDCTTSIGGPRCVHDSSFTGPSICAPKAYNGDPCSMGEDCDSGLCTYVGASQMCVECMISTDCTTSIGGPRCVLDESFTGPSFCAPKAYNGDPCSMGEDCDSGLCNYVGANQMCVECTSSTDCTTSIGGPRCVLDESFTGPSYCGPLAYNGDPCSMGEDCDSGLCTYVGPDMMCVECNSDTDCTTSVGGPYCTADGSVPGWCGY